MIVHELMHARMGFWGNLFFMNKKRHDKIDDIQARVLNTYDILGSYDNFKGCK